MKKFTSLTITLCLFIMTFMLNSCSKERRFNNKLEGKWKVLEINSQSLGSDYAFFEFTPNKDIGIYSYTAYVGNDVYYDFGTYSLYKDRDIIITSDLSSETYKYSLIKKYEKRKLVGFHMSSYDYNGVSFELQKM